MTVLALLLAVVAFAFLVLALVLASKAWAIACIVVGAIGAVSYTHLTLPTKA